MTIRNETTPFDGDYTGRDDIGKPTCKHVARRFRGVRIAPIRCLRFADNRRGYCFLHNTTAKRSVDN